MLYSRYPVENTGGFLELFLDTIEHKIHLECQVSSSLSECRGEPKLSYINIFQASAYRYVLQPLELVHMYLEMIEEWRRVQLLRALTLKEWEEKRCIIKETKEE